MFATARKAVVAFVVAGTGSLAVAGVDNAVTLGEVLVALAAACAAFGAVYGVRNVPQPVEEVFPEDPS